MSAPTERLIGDLAADLRPVRRLPAPGTRALVWLGFVAVFGVALAAFADLPEAIARVTSAPDMGLAVVGSVATTILAGLAACALSVPGYSARWAWVPLPGVLLWVGSSGAGCLRGVVLATLQRATWADATVHCVPFILEASAVLAIPLGVLLWWARPLRPGLVAAMGGLAVAAGSASLLWLVHPFDASLEDLVMHTVAVLVVVAICRLIAVIAGPPRPLRPQAG